MTSTIKNNGRVTVNRILWAIVGALWVITMAFGGALLKNIRADITNAQNIANKAVITNASQQSDINNIIKSLDKIEKKIDTVLYRLNK